jgi:entericidin A
MTVKKLTKFGRLGLAAATLGAAALVLAGCATVKGVGRDITSVGQAGSDAIH